MSLLLVGTVTMVVGASQLVNIIFHQVSAPQSIQLMKYAKNSLFATNVSISISLVNATQTKSVICGLGTTLLTSLLTLPVKTTHPLTPTTGALDTPANATGFSLLDSDYITGGGTSTSTPGGDPSTGWPIASQGTVTTDKMPAAVATVLLLMNGANPTFL